PHAGAAAAVYPLRLFRSSRRQVGQALPHPPRPLHEHRPARQERPARVRLVLLPRGQPRNRRCHAGAEGGAGAVRGRGAEDRQQDVVICRVQCCGAALHRWTLTSIDEFVESGLGAIALRTIAPYACATPPPVARPSTCATVKPLPAIATE